MKINRLIFILFLWSLSSWSGWAANAVDIPDGHTTDLNKMVLFVKSRCKTTEDRLWTIQAWLSKNVIYDSSIKGSIAEGKQEQEALVTLKTKRGVCAQYANLFSVLARKMGIDMFVVDGYTQEKLTVMKDSHSWCVALIDSVPYYFDPTWSSGYVEPSGTYVKSLDKQCFMRHPDSLRYTHIPYDPLMQFSEHPLKYQQLLVGEPANEQENGFFNWRDSLSLYRSQDSLAQFQSVYRRVKNNGKPNSFVTAHLSYLSQWLSINAYNMNCDKLNEQGQRITDVSKRLSEAHNWLVDINYLNPSTERTIQETLDKVAADLDDIAVQLQKVDTKDKQLLQSKRTYQSHVGLNKKRHAQCVALLKKKKGKGQKM